MFEISDLKAKKLPELQEIAKGLDVPKYRTQKIQSNTNKNPRHQKNSYDKSNYDKDLKNRYKAPEFEFDSIIESEGVLDIMQDGYGFLRSSDYNYPVSYTHLRAH